MIKRTIQKSLLYIKPYFGYFSPSLLSANSSFSSPHINNSHSLVVVENVKSNKSGIIELNSS